jgi:hypothetical protein
MATRRKGRPKGYAPWAPKDETERVVRAVQHVLQEYRDHLPLTVRQIFYRLVGQYGYSKTERAYARLCEYLVRARRAQMIPFEQIRDDGTIHNEYLKYQSVADFWEQVESNAEHYRRDKLANQAVFIELWCEAGGMVPQMERVANPYSVPVYSTGGFSSLTVTHEIAERVLGRDKPTIFLHVGDYDPSGESIFEAMTLDAKALALQRLYWRMSKDGASEAEIARAFPDGQLHLTADLPDGLPDLRPVRVALTADQVDEYDLPTAPPKATDTRSINWTGDTCQAEALPPDTLAEIVEAAILDRLDQDLLDETYSAEAREGGAIRRRVEALIEEAKEDDDD